MKEMKEIVAINAKFGKKNRRIEYKGLECFWDNRNVIDRVMIENGKEWIRKG